MKKVFVTGATSMIGVAFLEECIKQQVEAYILVRKDSKNNNRLPKESSYIHYVYGDIEHLEQLTIDQNFDVLYHFAWLGTDKVQRNQVSIQAKNIQITLDTIKFAKKIGCQKFIGAGSQSEYGFVDGIISEETPCNPTIAYGVSKYSSGKLSELLCKELNIEFIWGRIFSVYGKNDNSYAMIPQCLEHIQQKKTFQLSSCNQMWNFLHSEDCAKIFFLLGTTNLVKGIYNIAHPESRVLKEYIDVISNITNGVEYLNFGNNESKGIHPDVTKLTETLNWTSTISFRNGILQLLNSWSDNEKS